MNQNPLQSDLAELQDELAVSVNRVIVPIQSADQLISVVEKTLSPLAESLKTFDVEDKTVFYVPGDKTAWKLGTQIFEGSLKIVANRVGNNNLFEVSEAGYEFRVAAASRLAQFAWAINRHLEQMAKDAEEAGIRPSFDKPE